MRSWALLDASDVLIEGDVACISLFAFLVLKYVVVVVVYFTFCLMYACVKFLCISMYVVYV